MTLTTLLLGIGVLLITSIAATRASSRLGVPALLFFLLVGMLAGADGPGNYDFNDAGLAQAIGVVALVAILFSGGLDTDWPQIRPVLREGLILANIGVVLTAAAVGLFAVTFLQLEWKTALLLGAIVSSTDAAAVFAVLRGRGTNLKHSLEPLIELESGSNDPIAVFLTLGVISLIQQPESDLWSLVPRFIQQMTFGGFFGFVLGHLAATVINRIRLQQEGLYVVLSLAMMLAIYGAIDLIGGNGFLAVYIAGIVLGNRNVVHKRSILRFHDGVAWLAQITMFLTLGLLVYPSQLLPIAGQGLALALFLVFIARPLAVIISIGWLRRSLRQLLMISWVGLRGAVPIVLATFPLLAGIPGAGLIFNLVFFAVLVSVLLQGISLTWVADLLCVNNKDPLPEDQHLFVPEVSGASQMVEARLPSGSTLIGQTLLQAGLPRGLLVVQIGRNEQHLVPNGSTVFETGDHVLMLVAPTAISDVQSYCRRGDMEPLNDDRGIWPLPGQAQPARSLGSG
jgi:potassium/hydrogen antiporter